MQATIIINLNVSIAIVEIHIYVYMMTMHSTGFLKSFNKIFKQVKHKFYSVIEIEFIYINISASFSKITSSKML